MVGEAHITVGAEDALLTSVAVDVGGIAPTILQEEDLLSSGDGILDTLDEVRGERMLPCHLTKRT